MRRKSWATVLVAMLGMGVVDACTDETVEVVEETLVVPEGKMDNFFSLSAQEYMVEGLASVELESSYSDDDETTRLERLKELVYYRQIAVNWFLLQYLMGQDEHENKYQSLTKNGSYEDLELTADPENPLRYTFKFRQEVGGQLDLLSKLPTTMGDDGRHHFQLPVGVVSNTELARLELDREWYRSSPWSSFDPSTVDASKVEYLDLAIYAEEHSQDGWIDYERLFEDGKLTISVHFGWDYHSEYHLKHSRDVYDFLVSQGFKSPVSNYDAYLRTSGPLTRAIVANGRDVDVEVSLYWGKPGTDCDPDTSTGGRTLENDMREAFKVNDVVMFSGHSGPFYGFALANWKKTSEGDLDDSEVPGLAMPRDKYQVVLAEGCDTYALGQAFRQNPNKEGLRNLDVITTTNFSNASTAGVVRNFLTSMFEVSKSQHQPWTYSKLLQRLDGNSSWFHSMYGVHGIDDNPRLHPYAVTENFCVSCTVDEDCGPVGNKCIRLNDNEKVCSAECLDSEACPAGYECKSVHTGSWITSKQCLPSSLTCLSAPEEEQGARAMINELLADPPMDDAGDANGDGVRDAWGDEFVEIVSLSASPLDLSGWSLSDAFGTRFTFPQGTSLLPGRALVLFGGGDCEAVKESLAETGSLVFCTGGLGLTNTGDTVTIRNAVGDQVDAVTYGSEGGKDKSLNRLSDSDPKSSMGLHQGDLPFSPGVKMDGSLF